MDNTFEIYLAINENGEWEVASSSEDATSNLADNYGWEAIRVIKLNVAASLPVVSEIDVDVPEADDAEPTAKAA